MRLICLNIWKGKIRAPLLEFINREAETTDIFCFQEVTHLLRNDVEDTDMFFVLKEILPEFQGFFEPPHNEDFDNDIGLAIFTKKNNPIDEEGDFVLSSKKEITVSRAGRTFEKNAQFVKLSQLIGEVKREYVVVNFHGLWTLGEGQDTGERIKQFGKLKEFLNTLPGKKIVCGDFNVDPKTESVRIMSEGVRNLISEYGITSTRSRFFVHLEVVCDYMLVDKDVAVNDFKVLSDEVSDHLPLILDFD